MSKRRCADRTKAGKPCKGYPIEGSIYCQAHDPELVAQRAAWRSAGGLAKAIKEGKPVELLTVDDVRTGLAAVIGSLWELHNTPERGRALISAYGQALRTFETLNLTERIESLEARLEVLNGR
jgi:hypothetical protein